MPSDPTVVQAADVRAPSGSAVPTLVKVLAGTGSTEDTNDTAFTEGEMATIVNGAEPIRIAFGSATAPGVGTTDQIVGPYGRFDWFVGPRDTFCSIEAADGSTAYEAWAWTSSGPREA